MSTRAVSRLIFCPLLAFCMTDAPRVYAQNELLPDLFMAPGRLQNNVIDTTEIPGTILFRFDSSIPNIGAGEFRLEGNAGDAGNGRRFVNQRIMRDDMTSFVVDAGDFLYNPSTTSMESTTWVAYRIRQLLPPNGVGPILSTGGKPAVHITSSTSFDLNLPNAPAPQDRLLASGAIHGISVGYTDIYSRFLPMQWIDITGLPSGDYWLEVEVDVGDNVMESDETNNVTRIIVTLDLPDDDADGLNSSFEETLGLDPNDPDSDNDGLNDGAEVGYDGDAMNYNPYHPVNNPTGTDTDALNPDTDGDGIRDGSEVNFGFDPLDANSGAQLSNGGGAFRFLLFLILFFFSFRSLRRA